MKTEIFHLEIIPLESILVHEKFDESRAYPLVARLKKEKELFNPIIVAPLNGGKYLQLDGMNRLSAFKMLGLSSILAQVVDYNDQETVELSSWIHLFPGDKEDFLSFLSQKCGLGVKPGSKSLVGYRYIKEEGYGRLVTLCFQDGTVYLVYAGGDILEKIEKLNQLVSYYEEKITRAVLPSGAVSEGINGLFREYSSAKVMVVFPTFTRHQIIEVVKKGKLFPAGLTSNIIKRRCLNVRVPLALFDKRKKIEAQNQELEAFLSQRSFRLFEEPTVYFE